VHQFHTSHMRNRKVGFDTVAITQGRHNEVYISRKNGGMHNKCKSISLPLPGKKCNSHVLEVFANRNLAGSIHELLLAFHSSG
jgi:hypothetical protein